MKKYILIMVIFFSSVVCLSCTKSEGPEDGSSWEYVMDLPKANDKLHRIEVPGGWLVSASTTVGYQLVFVSDPEHLWMKED